MEKSSSAGAGSLFSSPALWLLKKAVGTRKVGVKVPHMRLWPCIMAEIGQAWTMLLAALGAAANHLHSIDALVDSMVRKSVCE